ncbi:hypothetical protein SAMN04489762_1172 [Terribacillus saccharophilus]|uniref:Uncharacterized protein n=1 Tax=Terribacillus saccharophilus TaxID=361277 RepID=A0A075LIB5_9BACI|nr:hypothetical protein GZ22_05580 [Terribacillus goriensis]SEM83802.1 hypothetical protein SAMN04489762_1172 [Terribacillus saccharophilus]
MFESDFVNLILKIISTWAVYLLVTYTIFDDLSRDRLLFVLFIIMSLVMIISTAIRIVKIVNIKKEQKAN